MKKIIALLILGLLLGLPLNGYPQERNPQALKALKALKQKIGNGFSVEWSEDGSRIIGLEMAEWSEKQSRKIPSLSLPEEVIGTPEEIATVFLKKNSELFQIHKDLADFRVENAQQQDEYTYYVHLQQIFDGLPVLDSGIGVVMDIRDSRFTLKGITSVISGYEPNINISTTPMLSEQEAITIAKQDTLKNHMVIFDKSGKRKVLGAEQRMLPIETSPHPERVIHISENEEPILVYRFRVEAAGGLVALEYLIDANTGTIIIAANTQQTALEKATHLAQSDE